jgi:glycopeptide antibiotics resistance protein
MAAVYLLFLIWAILWKCRMPYIGGEDRIINLMPFRGNAGYEKFFNLFIFAPLGFYLSASMRKQGVFGRIATLLAVSLTFEILQFALSIGRSDITDLLLNTLGGVIGICGFIAAAKLFGKHAGKAVTALCAAITAFILYCSVSLIAYGYVHLGYMMLRP